MNQFYLDTARTLVQAAPHIFFDDTFALKGGTAINLFFRDMPRLSVDLDLVLVDHTLPWKDARKCIDGALAESRKRLEAAGFKVAPGDKRGDDAKLQLSRDKILVKVEANYVMRGTVNPPAMRSLTDAASDKLQGEIEIPVVSLEDVYGGKLAAALDRQHPRDLFDVMQLFEHEGLTPGIRRAFVVYLASHKRPFHEVLFPTLRDIRMEYAQNFDGMTLEPVPLEALLAARERLLKEIQSGLDRDEREFLLSLAAGEPQWERLGTAHLARLPGVMWKLENLRNLRAKDPGKFELQRQELQRRLA